MRHGMTKETDWEYVGACLANSDDNDQISFFKAFVKECLSWGTHLQVEKQLAFVNTKMTEEEKDVLSMIVYKEGD